MSAVPVHTHPSVEAARADPTATTAGVLFLCVEHSSWFPYGVRPLTRLPDTFPAEG